jgi:hypothetical protein
MRPRRPAGVSQCTTCTVKCNRHDAPWSNCEIERLRIRDMQCCADTLLTSLPGLVLRLSIRMGPSRTSTSKRWILRYLATICPVPSSTMCVLYSLDGSSEVSWKPPSDSQMPRRPARSRKRRRTRPSSGVACRTVWRKGTCHTVSIGSACICVVRSFACMKAYCCSTSSAFSPMNEQHSGRYSMLQPAWHACSARRAQVWKLSIWLPVEAAM